MIRPLKMLPILICLFMAGGLLSEFATAAADTGVVTGKAVDADGIGIKGVEVSVCAKESDPPIGTATTEKAGAFSIRGIPLGTAVIVKAFHKGHMFDTGATKPDVTIPTEGTIDVGNLEMKVLKGSMRKPKEPGTTKPAQP